MKITGFGQHGASFNPTNRIHLISNNHRWIAICNTYLQRINISINTVKWKNICPACKRVYGKDLKQDIIVLKLKGEKH